MSKHTAPLPTGEGLGVGLFFLPLILSLDVIFPVMILRESLTIPCLHLSPRLNCIGPERMVGWQAERHEGEGCHIERAVVGIPVGNVLLAVSAETDREITLLVEIVLLVEHAMEHLGKRCTHLTIAQITRQRLIPCHQSQRLHRSHTVRNTSSERWEGSLRRDESLENDAVLRQRLNSLS